MALGYTRYITSALAARRGASLPLMPLLHKANAPDDAVAQLADAIPTRRVTPRRLPGALQFWRNLGRKPTKLRFLPFPIPHELIRHLMTWAERLK